MKPGEIRPIAICIFRDRDRLFVAEYYDALDGKFYRPLGGAIEFGERGHECIVREIREETGAEIKEITYLGTLESIFSFEGKAGHEIVLVYRARFVEPHLYEIESLVCRDDGGHFTARWLPLDELRAGPTPLYPDDILDFVDRAEQDGPTSLNQER